MMCPDTTIGAGGVKPPVLAGRVTNTNGDPIANATITFGGGSPTHQDMGQLTSNEGVFFYPTLAPGTYELLINDPNGLQVKLNVDVDPAKPQNLRIVMPDTAGGGG